MKRLLFLLFIFFAIPINAHAGFWVSSVGGVTTTALPDSFLNHHLTAWIDTVFFGALKDTKLYRSKANTMATLDTLDGEYSYWKDINIKYGGDLFIEDTAGNLTRVYSKSEKYIEIVDTLGVTGNLNVGGNVAATGTVSDGTGEIRAAVDLKLAKSALNDSLQNDHPEIKADTLTYKYANKTIATYWDLYNDLEVDSLAANGDSIKVWSRPKFTAADKDTSWRLLLQGYGDTGDDSLLLGNTGYAVVDNPDTAKIWLACSDTTNCRIDFLVTNSNGDTVFYDYDIVLTGGATMTEYTILAYGAEVFDANERYCVTVKVYLDTGDWAIIGKARCVG